MGSSENQNWLLDCPLRESGSFDQVLLFHCFGFSRKVLVFFSICSRYRVTETGWLPVRKFTPFFLFNCRWRMGRLIDFFGSLEDTVSLGIDGPFTDPHGLQEVASRKRPRMESCAPPGSKACREKLRRDKLNDRFLELGAILEPGKPPKMDKAAILSDAVRLVKQLRGEAQKLKESSEGLQEKIKELKTEKNELRDEKQRLKVEKENLEQQIKAYSARPSFAPHPPILPAPFPVQGQNMGNKLMMPVIGFSGFPMWQYMPPADVDTSQDVESCPPVA